MGRINLGGVAVYLAEADALVAGLCERDGETADAAEGVEEFHGREGRM